MWIQIIGNIALWVLTVVVFVIVLIKSKGSVKKAIEASQGYREYVKGDETMKKEQLIALLKENGVSEETINKMLSITDAVIEVKGIYTGVDAASKYLAGSLVKRNTSRGEIYYEIDEQVK